jgi:hypothetical protein
MKRFMIGGMVWAFVGAVAFFALRTTNAPEPGPQQQPKARPVAPVSPAPPPKAPVVLADVVDVADIDPLLDPLIKPLGGVPFDPEPVTVPVASPGAPARIPPAAEDCGPDIAPMPREATIATAGIGLFF